jgi:hypothetical protein
VCEREVKREGERECEKEGERESDECPHFLLARVILDATLSPSSQRERKREKKNGGRERVSEKERVRKRE